MKNFKELTHNTFTVMGKKTADSIPLPLPYRVPIIVSSSDHPKFITIDHTKHNVLDYLQLSIEQGIDAVYSIIGGTSLLTVDNLTRCNEVYYTEFNREFPEADTYLGKDVLKWLQEQDKEVLDECEEFTLYRIINETV